MNSQNINIATKNQIFLFSILELLIEDMKYKVSNIYLVRNKLSFQLNKIMYFISIENDKIKYTEDLIDDENNISKSLKRLEFRTNDNSYLNIMSEILSNKLDLESTIFNSLNVQFKFCKMLMWFDISIIIEDEILIITNIKNNIELIVYQFEPNVYKIQIRKEISDEKYNVYYETLFEYINEINNLSKYYDIDKKQQIVNIASKLFENYE